MQSLKMNNITKFQIFSICLLIFTLLMVVGNRFSVPHEYVYKAWDNSGEGAVYYVLKNIENVVSEDEFNSLMKTLLLNHSEPSVIKLASDKEFVKTNKDLLKLVVISKEFYLKMDTNISWRGFSNKRALNYYSSKQFQGK